MVSHIWQQRCRDFCLSAESRTCSRLQPILSVHTSHSLRVGVAQDNFAAREPLPAIMQAYRWRDPKTVLRYGAQLAVKSGAAARMAARVSEN